MANFVFRIGHLVIVFWLLIILQGCGSSTDSAYLTISPSSATVGNGKTQQFSASYYESGRSVSVSASWSVSGDVGTIDQNGLFTGTKDGTGQVLASYQDKSASASVTVSSNGYVSVSITDTSGSIASGIKVYLVENPSYYTTVSENGKAYTIGPVVPGTYTLTVDEAADYLGTSESVTVATAETASKSMNLIARLSIFGEVISDSGLNKSVSGYVRNSGKITCESVTVTYIFIYDDNGITSVSSGKINATPSTVSPEGITAFFGLEPFPPITSYVSYTRKASYKH